jgi:hypothetical protein
MLLGPLTWAPVAARMAQAVVPSLAGADPPFWPHVAARVAEAVPVDRPVVVVAHSNAGVMVPVIVRSLQRPVVGCVFVDARLPARTGTTPTATPERLEFLRGEAVDGLLPPWTTWWAESDVARLFPDPRTRAAVSAEQPRLPLSYYEQRIPVPAGWDDRPCGYLWFGPPYDREAAAARERGWAVDHLPGGHLHQLVDPDTVAARIIAMAGPWNDTRIRRVP